MNGGNPKGIAMKKTVSTSGPNKPAIHLGGFEIAYVVRDFQPVETSPDGFMTTLGQMLDNSLATALQEGKAVQDVAFHFDTSNDLQMMALREMYMNAPIHPETYEA